MIVDEQLKAQADPRLDPAGAIAVKPIADMLRVMLLDRGQVLYGYFHEAKGL